MRAITGFRSLLPAHFPKFGSHGSNVQIVSAGGSPFQQLGVETNQRLQFSNQNRDIRFAPISNWILPFCSDELR